MDNAVALVQAYLRVNGYFTVAEFPVVEVMHRAEYRAITDLDILAYRFPGAGAEPLTRRSRAARPGRFQTDPELATASDLPDMILGEVKEGRAELNPSAREPRVIEAALRRFGCCAGHPVEPVVEALRRHGTAVTGVGHRIRLVAFGSIQSELPPRLHTVTLGHVLQFLEQYVREYWAELRSSQSKDPALSFLLMREKALRGEEYREDSRRTRRSSSARGGT
jgi:hypothetical protein